MADKVVLPLEKVLKAVERGFPTDGIFCKPKNFGGFTTELIEESFKALQRAGRIPVEAYHAHPKSSYDETLALDRELREKMPNITSRAKAIAFMLQLKESEHLAKSPSLFRTPPSKTIEKWLRGKWKPIATSGVVGVERYICEELGAKRALGQIRNSKWWPLNILLFLGHEVCGRSAADLEASIESMRTRKSFVAVKILRLLFLSSYPMDFWDVSTALRIKPEDALMLMQRLERYGYITGTHVRITRRRSEAPSIYYTVKGEEHKFAGLPDKFKGYSKNSTSSTIPSEFKSSPSTTRA